ncbi:hypothetical protein KA005_66650, partial [bacterium]|nr:hypothetical protein [bacterium]
YFKKGMYQEAKVQLERAIELIKSDAIVFDHLGDVYKVLENDEKALLNWQKSLEIDSENKQVKDKIEELKKSEEE